MNRSELAKAVARKTRVPNAVADDVIVAFVDLLALNLAVDEQVNLRGFGKFRVSKRPPTQLRHPRTGAPIDVKERRTVVFVPSQRFKQKLNGGGSFTVSGPRRPTHQGVRRKKTRLEIPQESLHAYLWRRVDERGRVDVDIETIALDHGVNYQIAHRAIKLARNDGRIRLAAWKRDRLTVYQVADPATYKRKDPSTHARINEEPVWG